MSSTRCRLLLFNSLDLSNLVEWVLETIVDECLHRGVEAMELYSIKERISRNAYIDGVVGVCVVMLMFKG